MKHHIVYTIKIVENKNLFFLNVKSFKNYKNIHYLLLYSYFTLILNEIIYFFLLIDISILILILI